MTSAKLTAIIASIEFIGMLFDGYQLPNSRYFMSLTQTAKTIDIPLKRMSQLRELQLAQSLYPEGFQESELVKVVGGTKPVKVVSIDDAVKYWVLAASVGNKQAFNLVAACVTETLERRFDRAFNVVRTEQERDDKILQRVIHADGWRELFTDWQKKDGCVRGWEYAARVNELKVAAGLPISTIEGYSGRQIQILNNAEVIYDAMRRVGQSHCAALKVI